MRRAVSLSLLSALVLSPLLAIAARFPDVPGDHPYNSPIEALAIEGVITGNPDGNFYPARPVNRAEFLTMLYRAKKITASTTAGCFSDVKAGTWYAQVVCDASARGYIGGYPDGSFKPEQTVNRVEALKMIFKVFGFAVLTGTRAADAASQFTDVQADAWYTTYVSSAYMNGTLPIAGYNGTTFYPSNALLRGEAAAYIWNAMNITGDIGSTSSSVSSAAQSSRSQASSVSSVTTTKTSAVDFPFSDDGSMNGMKTLVYTFPLAGETSMQIDVSVAATDTGVACRLYLLGENNLSEQYYLGYQDAHSCHLRVDIPKGNYQLEVHPDDPTATYKVFTKTVTGDGNDGFSQALLLLPSKPKVGQLAVSDIADWYKFSLTVGGTHNVQTFGDHLSCLVYPLDDVDLFGFVGPTCNEMYDYPKGSYIVRVQRANNQDAALSYTVQLD